MTSVLLVEDHPILARAIENLLATRSTLDAFVTIRSAEETLERLAHLPAVDVALIDISLPGMSGLDLITTLVRARPELPCLALSGHRETTYVRRALEAGARGYMNKEHATQLPLAIEKVLAGEYYLSEDLMAVPDLARRIQQAR